uniref:Si:ch73-238c9.1 n=1 Tax=Salmo trutta TaxID=8032 RepID=A0A673WHY5_SALTR
LNFRSTLKRVVLHSRPDPPTVDHILADIRAFPNDPVFSVLEDRGSSDNEVETKYLQSCRYLEMNEWLQEVSGELMQQREELRTAGEQLGISVAGVKGRALEPVFMRHHTSGLGEHLTSGIGEHLTSGIGEHLTSELREHLTSGLREHLTSGLGEHLTSGLGEHLTSGLGEHLTSGLGEHLTSGLGENLT